jgi:S-methylmethionine-dependent homocysteine/selenocysteine methylase
MINCSSPSFFKLENEPSKVLSRLIGYQANGSSMEQAQLDQSADIQTDDLSDWGEHIAGPQSHMGIEDPRRCCGTGPEHLEYLARAVAADRS